jgi:hypothetical protein
LHVIATPEQKQGDSLVGRRFTRWAVLEFAGWTKNKLRLYLCRCDCGAEKLVYKCALDRGQSRSCGCLRGEETAARCREDLAGERFGRLVAESPARPTDKGWEHGVVRVLGERTDLRAQHDARGHGRRGAVSRIPLLAVHEVAVL